MDDTCDAVSGMLNCGCCDEVVLTCDLTKSHDGDKHRCTIEGKASKPFTGWVKYTVEWVKIDG